MTLHTLTERPYNAEASLDAVGAYITPVSEFYVRNNFDVPVIDEAAWRLRVHGLVASPIELDLAALKKLPHVTRRLTLECAGNGRRLMEPPTEGTPWGLGAAGTAVFSGASLRDVLVLAGPMEGAVECVFGGSDGGEPGSGEPGSGEPGSGEPGSGEPGSGEPKSGEPKSGKPDGGTPDGGKAGFRRSLPLGVCLDDDGPMVVWEMNGEPLTREHGFPVRLVVPNWYAVASVKWLVDIELIDHAFAGYFQADRYVYRHVRGGDGDGRRGEDERGGERGRDGDGSGDADGAADVPVTLMRVRSLITSHADGDRLGAGEHVIEGVAWSGMGSIERVEVAVAAASATSAAAATPGGTATSAPAESGVAAESAAESVAAAGAPARGWMSATVVGPAASGAAVRWQCRVQLPPGRCTLLVRATDSSGATQHEQPGWNELGYGFNAMHRVGLFID